jgi:hypothetical protein
MAVSLETCRMHVCSQVYTALRAHCAPTQIKIDDLARHACGIEAQACVCAGEKRARASGEGAEAEILSTARHLAKRAPCA